MHLETKDRELGKWSSNWEGSYKVYKVLEGNVYWLSSLDGKPHKKMYKWQVFEVILPSVSEENEKERLYGF